MKVKLKNIAKITRGERAKSKNKVKDNDHIYQTLGGDILLWRASEPVYYEEARQDVFSVFWSDEFLNWRTKNAANHEIDLYCYSYSEELAIIGNIYENSETIERIEKNAQKYQRR